MAWINLVDPLAMHRSINTLFKFSVSLEVDLHTEEKICVYNRQLDVTCPDVLYVLSSSQEKKKGLPKSGLDKFKFHVSTLTRICRSEHNETGPNFVLETKERNHRYNNKCFSDVLVILSSHSIYF